MQNFPLFKSITTGASTAHHRRAPLEGLDGLRPRLLRQPRSNFPREFLEGQTWIGTTQVTTDGNGDATFDETLPVGDRGDDADQRDGDRPAGQHLGVLAGAGFQIGPAVGPGGGRHRDPDQGHGFRRRRHRDRRRRPGHRRDRRRRNDDQREDPGSAGGCRRTTSRSTNTDATIGRVSKAYVSDFLDVTSGTFYSYVTTLVSNGITAGSAAATTA